MYKLIILFILTFFLNTGFVSKANLAEKEVDRQEKFLDFLSYFEKVSLPYSMDLKKFEGTAYSKKGNLKKNKKIYPGARIFPKGNGFFTSNECQI